MFYIVRKLVRVEGSKPYFDKLKKKILMFYIVKLGNW